MISKQGGLIRKEVSNHEENIFFIALLTAPD